MRRRLTKLACVASGVLAGSARIQIEVHECSDPKVKASCALLQRSAYSASQLDSYKDVKFAEGSLRNEVRELAQEFQGYAEGRGSAGNGSLGWASVRQEPALLPPFRVEKGGLGGVVEGRELSELRKNGVNKDRPHLLITATTTTVGGVPFVETNPVPETEEAELRVQNCVDSDTNCTTFVFTRLLVVKDPEFRCGGGHYASLPLSEVMAQFGEPDDSLSFEPYPVPALCVITLDDLLGEPQFIPGTPLPKQGGRIRIQFLDQTDPQKPLDPIDPQRSRDQTDSHTHTPNSAAQRAGLSDSVVVMAIITSGLLILADQILM